MEAKTGGAAAYRIFISDTHVAAATTALEKGRGPAFSLTSSPHLMVLRPPPLLCAALKEGGLYCFAFRSFPLDNTGARAR